MKLISNIDIRYFRSIYQTRLDHLDNVNVFFGRNDAGKSNVLRALNLFFNSESNPGTQFNFDRDFSDERKIEASKLTDARKFVSVRITFNTPKNWQKSLGKSFWVKRSWSPTRGTVAHLETSIKKSKSNQFLTRFLNQICFHYIPAIKDRRIFEELLAEIYSVVAHDQEFMKSLSDFSSELRSRTLFLSDGIKNQLDLNSVIAPPTDLTDLFRSLDFETRNDAGDTHSLTLQRGDGIQVRHLPSILGFLSDKSQMDYHLWGFEEPENSLELANAIEEAKSFCQYGKDSNKQIFLTSHSPAFFSLPNDKAKRFFVSQSKGKHGKQLSSIISLKPGNSDLPSELMGETPHLSVISNYLTEADFKIRKLQNEGKQLAELLAAGQRSLLFMEGETDCVILKAAWQHFIESVPPPFDLIGSSGTTQMESLARKGHVLNHLAPERSIFVLVDNDRAGRKLNDNNRLKRASAWVEHESNGTRWRRLPWTSEFEAIFSGLYVPKELWPGCLENIFTAEVRRQAIADGAYTIANEPHAELLESGNFKRIASAIQDPTSDQWLYVAAIDHEKKEDFADWIAHRAVSNPEILAPLQPVVEDLALFFES